jgi:hypothetical protein
MLKIKSLLLACSVAFPSFLIAIQPPAQAQGVSVRGTGANSGVSVRGTGANSGVSVRGTGANSGVSVRGTGDASGSDPDNAQNFGFPPGLLVILQVLGDIEVGSPIVGGVASDDGGNIVSVGGERFIRTIITISVPGSTIADITFTFDTPYPTAGSATDTPSGRAAAQAGRAKASVAAQAMALAGGKAEAVKLAARFGFAGAPSAKIVLAVGDIARLLASVRNGRTASSLINSNMASLPDQFAVSSLRTKSFDSSKSFVISQQTQAPGSSQGNVTLSVPALVAAINSYNDMIDESDAETVENISKDKRLGQINQSLKSLRALFPD